MLKLSLASLFLLLTATSAEALCSEGAQATVWECHQVTFASDVRYAHPVNDVQIDVTFSHESGGSIRVRAFWDGDTVYRARVAFPNVGTWTYDVATNDPSNTIGEKSGVIEVNAYEGDNPFSTKGWLRPSADSRFLTYADGTPFFWLGDTAWEIAARSHSEQIGPYIQDRQQKGFNALQIVANTHLEFFNDHIRNHQGESFLLSEDRSRPNPRYFDYLDRIVDEANRAGMVVAIVPLWATFTDPHRASSPHSLFYSIEEAVTQAAYIGARYAGHNVIWIVGGDQAYDTDEKRTYWDTFARALRSSSGDQHLMTVHPGGYSGSFDSWPTPPDWLDFHMYQASHMSDLRYLTDGEGNRQEDRYGSLRADGGFSWEGGLRGYHLDATIPVLNAEANYEDIISRFWESADPPVRVEAADVRHVAYWGLLSGSTVGFTYGANGVWSWTNAPVAADDWIRTSVEEAISFPGSSDMTTVRAFAEAHGWHQWVPRPDLVEEVDTDHFVAASVWDDRTVVYCPNGTRTFQLFPIGSSETAFELEWTHARTGATVREVAERTPPQPLLLAPPDEDDWLLVASPRPPVTTTSPRPVLDDVALTLIGPNPSRSSVRLGIRTATPQRVEVRLIDTLGRTVWIEQVEAASGTNEVRVDGLASGIYVAALTYWNGAQQSRTSEHVVTVTVTR